MRLGSPIEITPDNPAKMRVTLSAAVTADGYMDDDSPGG